MLELPLISYINTLTLCTYLGDPFLGTLNYYVLVLRTSTTYTYVHPRLVTGTYIPNPSLFCLQSQSGREARTESSRFRKLLDGRVDKDKEKTEKLPSGSGIQAGHYQSPFLKKLQRDRSLLSKLLPSDSSLLTSYYLLSSSFDPFVNHKSHICKMQITMHTTRCVVCWKIFLLALPHGRCRKRNQYTFTPTAVACSRRYSAFSGESNCSAA